MKETGLIGKRRSTTIAATPDDGKSQRKRRRRSNILIATNILSNAIQFCATHFFIFALFINETIYYFPCIFYVPFI